MKVSSFKCYDPHALLGLHEESTTEKVIRLWRPGAEKVFLEVRGEVVPATQVDPDGLFEYSVDASLLPTEYRVYHQNGLLAHDPYAFLPTVGEWDQYLFGQGTHYKLFNIMGGRLAVEQGIAGCKFAVWAPCAKSVSLVGDFNYWNGKVNQMRSLGQSGIWELFVPGLEEGSKYKFEVQSQESGYKVKADPYALSSELRPSTASVIANIHRFQWEDQDWLSRRELERNDPKPLNIYEIHAGSWRKPYGRTLNYRELALELAEYCNEMGYTHVELMPIQEHPLDESWGYQVSGFYAVTSRFGTPEDFQWFVNHLHKRNIGVILDWVPGHFPTDDFSLARFDGTCLFEYEDPRKGFHPHWSTNIFNFGRKEVSNFLIANALYWFEMMHVDGLRVDAVASMLYLDYGRKSGEWIPNEYGGNDNLEAIEFFKHMNSVTHQRFPGVLTIAEESTAFPGVTHPVEQNGLGFDLKWNMGWMNDTLRYFSRDMIFRRYHHNDLTFGLLYVFTERFVLALSHDEVVHGKRSLLDKMPGDLWQKFANLRLLHTYQMCQPGKKLMFMGGEIGQWHEWWCKAELQWDLLAYETHRGLQRLVRDINRFYTYHPALWTHDFDHTGFEWVDFADLKNSVVSYLRKGKGQTLLCVHNFTPTCYNDYIVPLKHGKSIEEKFNSDADVYGGSNKRNAQMIPIGPDGAHVTLAPLATMIFEVK